MNNYRSERQTLNMAIQRCHNPAHPEFKDYGARGIRVCLSWRRNWRKFVEALGPRPVGMTLDRKNNDGNYEPSNCRWATRKMQAINSRHAVMHPANIASVQQNGYVRFAARKGVHTMPTKKKAPPRDFTRDRVLELMNEKHIEPKDVIAAVGMSKNSIYEFLNGKRGMRSGNSTRIIEWLQRQKKRPAVRA